MRFLEAPGDIWGKKGCVGGKTRTAAVSDERGGDTPSVENARRLSTSRIVG